MNTVTLPTIALTNAQHWTSTDTDRPTLQTIRIETDGKRIHIASTDSYTLAVQEHYHLDHNNATTEYTTPDTPQTELAVTLPISLVARLPRPRKTEEPTATVTVTWDDDTITLTTANTTVSEPNPQHTYPNWRQLIPDYNGTTDSQWAINPAYIARATKMKQHHPILRYAGSQDQLRPILFALPNQHPTAAADTLLLIMPIRPTEEKNYADNAPKTN